MEEFTPENRMLPVLTGSRVKKEVNPVDRLESNK
jgi:hypothetical protein